MSQGFVFVDPEPSADGAQPTSSIIDTRVITKPKAWDGKKSTFSHYKMRVMGYIGAVSQDLKKLMDELCSCDSERTDVEIDCRLSTNFLELS